MSPAVGERAVIIAREDDVATATADLVSETEILGVVLREPIAFGHKFALRAIPAGAPVRKYGEVIGRAVADIAAGEHVHIHNLASDRARGDRGTTR